MACGQKNTSRFQFQLEAWQHIINNENGVVNAPTGCGKTFSVFLGRSHPVHQRTPG
jgi:ATP-dependent Lhr-like helicase